MYENKCFYSLTYFLIYNTEFYPSVFVWFLVTLFIECLLFKSGFVDKGLIV